MRFQERDESKVGTGLLGFDPKPLGDGDLAYLKALGIEGPGVDLFMEEIKGMVHPLPPR